MDKVQHITLNTFKVIVRGNLWRLPVILICVVLFVTQVILHGDHRVAYQFVGWTLMPSFFPQENQMIFTVLQVFFIFWEIGNFFGRELDTEEAILCRPESNRELLWGYFGGFFVSSLIVAVLACGVGMIASMFCKSAFWAGAYYLFYLCTLTIPALVFYMGLAFLVFVWIRVVFLGLLLLLGCFFMNLFWCDGIAGGVFDPLGVFLPNVFSNVTGHAGLWLYFVQRGCWLLIGVGLLEWAVVVFERLPNRRGVRVLSGVLLVMGVICGFSFYWNYRENKSVREKYRETYVRYADNACLTRVNQDIHVRLDGEHMACSSRMTLRNETDAFLSEVVFYLNPALEVKGIREKGRELRFARERQVVRVEREVGVSDSLEIEIVYSGGIDDRVCYLDVADEVYEKVGNKHFGVCRFGKHNAFLGEDYTLLLPECLWYPVTEAPVNPASPFEPGISFTTYRLTVSGYGKQKVIAQGKRMRTKEWVTFEPERPLQGMSLCAGDFVSWGVTVDSVYYELNIAPENLDMLKGLSRAGTLMSALIRELKEEMEEQMRQPYPYERLVLVEAPLSFNSYLRAQRGGCEYVQPEIIFFPERGVGYCRNVAWEKARGRKVKQMYEAMRKNGIELLDEGEKETAAQLEHDIVECFLRTFLRNEVVLGGGWTVERMNLSPLEWFGTKENCKNEYDLSILFHERLRHVYSREFPSVNMFMNNIVKSESKRYQWIAYGRFYEEEALEYLKEHSLAEALREPDLSEGVRETIVVMKTDELIKLFNSKGVPPGEFFVCVDSCMRAGAFRKLDFEDIWSIFRERYGVDWESVFRDWFEQRGMPTYLVKKFEVKEVNRQKVAMEDCISLVDVHKLLQQSRRRYQIYLEIYNDSDMDGVVALVDDVKENVRDRSHYLGRYKAVNVELKAGEGISMVREYDNFNPRLELGISNNMPRSFRRQSYDVAEPMADTMRVVGREYFTGNGNLREVVVDNEDEGFRIKEGRSFILTDWFHEKREKRKYERGMDNPSGSNWKYCLWEGAYGTPVQSWVYKLAGKGDSYVSWSVPLTLAGKYEVFAHARGCSVGYGHSKWQKRGVRESRRLTFPQVYTIKQGEKEYVVREDTRSWDLMLTQSDDYWVSLGEFSFKPGIVKVFLWDKGEEVDQVIVADAVKFVFIEK